MAGKASVIKIVAIPLIAAVVIIYIVINSKNQYKPVMIGDRAPEFVLPKLGGGKIDLAKERGRIVFINFWATWCTACKEEMASMQWMYNKLIKKYPDKFRMYAVSIDSTDVPDVVIKYMEENNLSFPVLLDTDGKVKELYRTTGVPETYVVDENGIVRIKVIGPRDWYNPDNYLPVEALIKKIS